MGEKITLRAKSDGTEISGELVAEFEGGWSIGLAPEVPYNMFDMGSWDRVYELPTKPGTVFKATVFGVPNTRVMVSTPEAAYDRRVYATAARTRGVYFHEPEDIDASTVVIELEGDVE